MSTWYRIEHNGNTHYFNKEKIAAVEIHPTAPSGISEAQPWYAVQFFGDGPEPIAKLIFGELAEANDAVERFLGGDRIY
ncbi:MAG TPA: hypothetical protein VEC06_09085 [Paucimonas sp.]|nr:hypothetical protein [Paucimonas sp.]